MLTLLSQFGDEGDRIVCLGWGIECGGVSVGLGESTKGNTEDGRERINKGPLGS